MARWGHLKERTAGMMKRAVTRAMLLLLLCTCAAASSEHWVALAKSGGGKTRVYIETSGVHIDGAVRSAWIRNAFKPRTRNMVGTQPDEWVSFVASHLVTDCDKRTYGEDSMYWFYGNSDKDPIPADQIAALWTWLNPVKTAELEMEFICGWKPQ